MFYKQMPKVALGYHGKYAFLWLFQEHHTKLSNCYLLAYFHLLVFGQKKRFLIPMFQTMLSDQLFLHRHRHAEHNKNSLHGN